MSIILDQPQPVDLSKTCSTCKHCVKGLQFNQEVSMCRANPPVIVVVHSIQVNQITQQPALVAQVVTMFPSVNVKADFCARHEVDVRLQ
jgi:hypothetical protein